MSDENLLQQYSNACATLGNTQTMIHLFKQRIQTLVEALKKLDAQYLKEVEITLTLRRQIDKKGNHEN